MSFSKPLAELTTFRVGGPARQFIEATDEATLVEAVRIADEAGDPVLIIAGGSNVLVSDAGFDGTVIAVRTRGIDVSSDACSGASVTVAAGETLDDLVALAVEKGWVGIESLSGVPGSIGATPIQNVGAYGQEVADTIVSVRVFDRYQRKIRTIMHVNCDFSYRSSLFKRQAQQFVVLSVTFQFRLGDLSAPIRFDQLARALGVATGDRAPLTAVREAVLTLRRSKGMVLDPSDHDTWSAGSFFTNPILTAEQAERLPADAPRFEQPDGRIKTSAAWLIDHAGFAKGHGSQSVSLSAKHVLALTNRGPGTAAELMSLAREVRAGVLGTYGIELVNEPILVGVSW